MIIHPSPSSDAPKPPVRRIAGAVCRNGTLVELIYDVDAETTRFAIWGEGAWRVAEDFTDDRGFRVLPYSVSHNLIEHGVVSLPEAPGEYGSVESLVQSIRAFLHRYVAVSSGFEEIAVYYVLLTWIYDGFPELPYLRVRGAFGSGKTRFLLTVGSLCYRALFASGASTVAPLFHMLDAFRGTLVLDESDFRLSDEKAEITKILNNGNAKGFPVLRMEGSREGVFRPRAFHVFGPKVVASRGEFEDRALESRFLTEGMAAPTARRDVPISLPDGFAAEARTLRNQLLLFRFRNLGKKPIAEATHGLEVEPRLAQIFAPLLAVMDSPTARARTWDFMRGLDQELRTDRGLEIEAQVLEAIRDLDTDDPQRVLSIGDVTKHFCERFGAEWSNSVTNKSIGFIVRRKLQLRTQKSRGVFILPWTERAKLKALYARYGLTTERQGGREAEPRSDIRDVGDFLAPVVERNDGRQ